MKQLISKYGVKLQKKEESTSSKKEKLKSLISSETEGILMRIDSESNSMKVCDLRSFKIRDVKA